MKSNKKRIWFFVKILISAGLLCVLLLSVHVPSLIAQLRAVGPWAAILSGLCFVLATVVNTWRWQQLLSAQDLATSFKKLLSYNVAYAFYTVALPGGRIAAEGVRIYQIIRDHSDIAAQARATLCAIADRLFALGSFVLIVCGFVIFDRAVTFGFSPFLVGALVAVAVVSIAFALVPPSWLLAPLRRFFPALAKVPSFSHLLRSFLSHPFNLTFALGASFVADAFFALGAYIPAHALGLSISYPLMLFVFSVSMIAAFIPVTLAGIGLREGALAYLLVVIAGASPESALSVSIVTLVSSLMVACMGAIVEFHYHFLRTERATM